MELNVVLTNAIKSGDPAALEKRLGKGCNIVEGEPLVTLYALEAATPNLPKAAGATPKRSGEELAGYVPWRPC